MTEQEQFISEEILPENGKWSELRKYREDLNVAGEAILWFGIWTVIKTYLTVLLNEELGEMIQKMNPTDLDQLYTRLGVLAVFTCLLFLIHFLIYRGAEKEGYGQKTGPMYLVLAGLFMIGCIIGIVMTVFQISILKDTSLFSVVLDGTLALICADILYNGIQCRNLSEKLEAQEDMGNEQ